MLVVSHDQNLYTSVFIFQILNLPLLSRLLRQSRARLYRVAGKCFWARAVAACPKHRMKVGGSNKNCHCRL